VGSTEKKIKAGGCGGNLLYCLEMSPTSATHIPTRTPSAKSAETVKILLK